MPTLATDFAFYVASAVWKSLMVHKRQMAFSCTELVAVPSLEFFSTVLAYFLHDKRVFLFIVFMLILYAEKSLS